ncbi:MAG: repeat-containing protein [Bryobacterales bacterium]|nr:repeat-containing protein [Bryobacterales bacterium]
MEHVPADGHGPLLFPVTTDTFPDNALKAAAFYHEPSDQYYKTYRKGGRLYQRRHQVGFDGQETNVVEKEVDFIIGSGNHVRTFLNRAADGRIFELPMGWYADGGGLWAMNPGYDRPDHDNFRRQISGQCMFCHNGYPEIQEGADRNGTAQLFPGFIPDGIDCQRCHGPGRAHIINPAKLSPDRQLDLCMQCHLETTSLRLPQGIVRYSRGIFSFRPGESLSDYSLSFDHAAGTGHDDKFEIASAAYRLRKSACFRESQGRLQCTTCHNPHDIPRGKEAERHYDAACRTCHAEAFQSLVARNRHTASENCAACHMPRRRTDDVVHAVMTDHFIQRHKPARDLLAPLREKRESDETAYKGVVVPYYPVRLDNPESELYLAVAQVRQGANLAAGIPQLERLLAKHHPRGGEFYFELAQAYRKTGELGKAIAMYTEALRYSPGFLPAVRSLGSALAQSGQLQKAAEQMERALAIVPDDPQMLNDLALIYVGQGKGRDAVALLQRALQRLPDMADAYNNLGGALTLTGDRGGAEEAYRNAIRVQSDLAGAHRNLASLLTGREQRAEADYHYRKAIASAPADAATHLEYANALAQRSLYNEAAEQFGIVVRLEPTNADAYNSLGDMEALLGNNAVAIRHYNRAVAVKPNFAAAYLGLGSTLAATGKRSEAIPNLETAAGSPQCGDPASGTGCPTRVAALTRYTGCYGSTRFR